MGGVWVIGSSEPSAVARVGTSSRTTCCSAPWLRRAAAERWQRRMVTALCGGGAVARGGRGLWLEMRAASQDLRAEMRAASQDLRVESG